MGRTRLRELDFHQLEPLHRDRELVLLLPDSGLGPGDLRLQLGRLLLGRPQERFNGLSQDRQLALAKVDRLRRAVVESAAPSRNGGPSGRARSEPVDLPLPGWR